MRLSSGCPGSRTRGARAARPSASCTRRPAENREEQLKPDVAALIKQSTDAYKKMKTYRHTALFVREGTNPLTGATVKQESRFTLALDRPNKFVYKNDTQPLQAAVSDGKTFINFKTDETWALPPNTPNRPRLQTSRASISSMMSPSNRLPCM